MEDKVISYTVEHQLTVNELKDVITTAVEGGIGYWACLLNDDADYQESFKELKEEMPDGPCYCDIIYRTIEKGKAVKFLDEEEDETYSLTYENLLNGIKLFEAKRGKSVHKCLEEGDFDAIDGDAVFQYALFGELIYG
ncbi:MAG: hypothetical protein KBT06_04400 [Prevotellaceae bacterium]|nr:hypothetical protein [Candidatus Colivivens equi]